MNETSWRSMVLGVLALLPSLSAVAAAPRLADVARPVGAHVALIDSTLIHNGRSLAMATFATRQDVESVLEWYRTHWSQADTDPAFVEAQVGEWHVISRLSGDYNIVLQLRDDPSQGSRGLLSIMDVRTRGQAAQRTTAGVPTDARILSDTRSSSLRGEAATRVLRSELQPAQAAASVLETFRTDGWSIASQAGDSAARVLLFARGGDTAEVVVTADARGGSLIVSNTVAAGRGDD